MMAPGSGVMAGKRWHALTTLPYLTALAVGLGFLIVATLPMPGSNDYGRWLSTTRPYLGLAIPDYQDYSYLPPLIPATLALVRLLVGDPITSVRVFDLILLVALITGFAFAGWTFYRTREAALAAVLLPLLFTDRFHDLFAFGGLPQIGATVFTLMAYGAFMRGGRGSESKARRWWFAASLFLGLVALSHVGTAVIIVPLGAGIAVLSFLSRWQHDRTTSPRWLFPLVLVLVPLAAYWILVAFPANVGYASNPASLNYRGPDRLLANLSGDWPNRLILAIGVVTVGWGGLADVKRRVVGPPLVLAVWAAATWSAFALAVASGAGTDYPRFATIIAAPLLLGVAGGLSRLSRWLMRRVGLIQVLARREAAMILLAALAIAATPFAIDRYARQYTFYGVPDGEAFVRAISYIDSVLPPRDASVLAPAQGGPWVEGLTGRPALASYPVRYQFRPDFWQRGIDAEVLQNASVALTNEFFLVEYTGRRNAGDGEVPINLVIAANHGGEFVNLLTLAHEDTSVGPQRGGTSLASLSATGATATQDDSEAVLRTEWRGSGSTAAIRFVRTVRLARGDPNLSLTDDTPSGETIVLYAAPGIAFNSVETSANEAHVCFSRRGNSMPCLDLRVVHPEARIETTDRGGLLVLGGASGGLQLQITDLTAGGAFVGLGLLEPRELMTKYNVGAAIVDAYDPSYDETVERLGALGLRSSFVDGMYAVLLREP
jgi:hypothetical protein